MTALRSDVVTISEWTFLVLAFCCLDFGWFIFLNFCCSLLDSNMLLKGRNEKIVLCLAEVVLDFFLLVLYASDFIYVVC